MTLRWVLSVAHASWTKNAEPSGSVNVSCAVFNVDDGKVLE
jgi:hypothetical protein